MLLIGGLDPGNTGAVAMWDNDAGKIVEVFDLPNYKIVLNKTQRWRLDEDALQLLFEFFKASGMSLLVIESVMGMPKQSAPRAFQFGETYGVLRTTARYCGLTLHYASPTVWKLQERVPRDEAAICAKAKREFPEHEKEFTGKRGGFRHDRAEACFLARYGGRKIWPALQPRAKLREAIKRIGA